jgi:hypothetical protein
MRFHAFHMNARVRDAGFDLDHFEKALCRNGLSNQQPAYLAFTAIKREGSRRLLAPDRRRLFRTNQEMDTTSYSKRFPSLIVTDSAKLFCVLQKTIKMTLTVHVKPFARKTIGARMRDVTGDVFRAYTTSLAHRGALHFCNHAPFSPSIPQY